MSENKFSESQFREEIQNAPLGRPPYPHTLTTLGADIDVSLSLPQLLSAWEYHPELTRKEIERLAKTDHEAETLEALLRLWQSVGRPASGFWLETRVFVNRIIVSGM